jgi:tripartite-type tricarboxylate transporter receptor subunit TctC
MKRPHRRQFLHLAAGIAALPAVPQIARAQSYPARPVRIVVAAAAGGTTDILARLFAQWLSDRLGQQFLIDNRAGGSNNIGTEAVVRAPADGHTLLLANTVNAINATLYGNLSYNFIRDIAPVASLDREPNVIVLHPSIPATTVPEFISFVKVNAGRVNIGSAGYGTTSHMASELFKLMTGVRFVHVPYRGGALALIDLLGGQIQAMFVTLPGAIEYIKTGKLRALAVTTAARSEAFPVLPTMAEFVPGFEISAWYGIGAPRHTPEAIIDKLNKEINAALADPDVKARLADLGGSPLALSPAKFRKFISDDTEKWAKIIRTANIKPE